MNAEARNAATRFHNEAMSVIQTDKTAAYRMLCSAVTVDPSMAQGLFAMGTALEDLKHGPSAIAAYRRVLELPIGGRPESGDMSMALRCKVLINLGHQLLNDGQLEEGEAVSRQAIRMLEIDPMLDSEGGAFVYTNLSVILSITGRIEESVKYAWRGYELAPNNPIIQTGLAFALLFAGDFAEGLKQFEARIAYKLPLLMNMPYVRWDGGRVDTLLIESDQGSGDSLSYTRFIPEAASRVGEVIYRVQPELLRLISGALAPWENVEVVPQSRDFPIADAWTPVVSLPVVYGLTTDQILQAPQLWQPMEYVAQAPSQWKTADRSLHIAIAWAGSPMNDIDRHRSIPVHEFLNLYRVPGVQLYSVQVGERAMDLHNIGAAAHIRDMSPWIRDAADTVAILRKMDLVIACESFVAHLAGAIGKETWVPYSYLGGDYRIGREGKRSIWYPNHRIFKQDRRCTWRPVFEKIVEALKARAQRRELPVIADAVKAAIR